MRGLDGLRVTLLTASASRLGGGVATALYSHAAMLREAGAEVTVWNRTPERARALAADLGVRATEAPGPADIIVHCTSVGLKDPPATFKALPIAADDLRAGSLVVDMVYRDGDTRLLEAARTRGTRVVDGLGVLVAQGAASLERWTGREAPREAMREAATTIADT